ncbi:MAG: hypothetical protein ACYC3S_10615 [Chloroflexota bacterium]
MNRNTSDLFYNIDGKVAGVLRNGWCEKTADSRIHQLHKPPAWAIDRNHLEQLKAVEAKGVRITDEAGRVWATPLANFLQYGEDLNRGHGLQVLLRLKYWTVTSPGVQQLTLWEAVA